MNTTLTVIKADVGSIGGHIQPSPELIDEVARYVRESGEDELMQRLEERFVVRQPEPASV